MNVHKRIVNSSQQICLFPYNKVIKFILHYSLLISLVQHRYTNQYEERILKIEEIVIIMTIFLIATTNFIYKTNIT